MITRAVIGIDTSHYTTSVAAVSQDDTRLLAEKRQLLPVPLGEVGLRQSQALFHHVTHLPALIDSLVAENDRPMSWAAVGVSVRPRPSSTSYMPVFMAGRSIASSLASLLQIPLFETSHQEGHVEAAYLSLDLKPTEPSLVVHLSGGTSDVFVATPTTEGYQIDMIGEGADLHVGQFVDRVGVRLGMPFPAGPSLEQLASTAPTSANFHLPSRAIGARLSFSGSCSAALRALDDGVEPATVAFAVQACIANAVMKAIRTALSERTEIQRVLVVGGVASNQWIRQRVTERLRLLLPLVQIRFAPPKFASDNAYGVAGITHRRLFAIERL